MGDCSTKQKQNDNKIYAILRRVKWEEDDVEGMKEESGCKKVDQFYEIYIW